MNFIKITKRNFSKFVYRQNFEIFGHKLTLENINTRKQLAVKLYKLYYRFLDIKKIYKNSNQFGLIKLIILTEIFLFTGKIFLEFYSDIYKKDLEKQINNIEKNTKKSIDSETFIENNSSLKNDFLKKNINKFFEGRKHMLNSSDGEILFSLATNPNSCFYRSNILELGVNLYFISVLGKYLTIINPSAFKRILVLSVLSNISCLYANEKVKNFVMKKSEIKNFNIFKDTSFLSKTLITFSFFAFLEKILANKKIGLDYFRINRKPLLLLINFFIFAKLTNFLSIYTCDSIK